MTIISVVERVTPHCRRCGSALRLANSLQSGYCCCHRNTCGDYEAPGCVVCGREIDGIDVVVGICSRCSIVAPQSPAVAVAPRCAAAGTNSRRDPSIPTENTGQPACPASEGAGVATGEGEAPYSTPAPELTPIEPESA